MSTGSSSLSSQEHTAGNRQLVNDVSAASNNSTRAIKSTKSLYQVAQQVKFLHLQAEVESLLQQLQMLNKQRLATASYNTGDNRH